MRITDRQLAAIIKGIVPEIREQVMHEITTLTVVCEAQQATIATLQTKLLALEAKPSVTFKGVWRAETAYTPGDAAIRHGSLWICTADTQGEPGKDFGAWTLAVKRGAA
jgi:hypothetical protein